MSRVGHYLQEHLIGDVISSTDARRYFSQDGSILTQAPSLIVYPKNENDIRKVARFSWQLAERGRIMPLTARGYGHDLTGGAIGSGILLVFPAHLNRILELDTKAKLVTVEPGINYAKLQQALHTHGLFLPPYPTSIDNATVGGAIANNVSGEKSAKYGDTKEYVKSLRLVLSNGEVIETKRLSKRELSKKLGLTTFEGEIYRSIDILLEENHQLIDSLRRGTLTNNAGYNLAAVKYKDGSFDLTPLIAGSQGTLGIISEAVLRLEPYNPKTTLFLAQFDSLEHLQQAVLALMSLTERPSLIELVDGTSLEQIHKLNPTYLNEVLEPPFPAFSLIVEFDGAERAIKKGAKQAERILHQYAKDTRQATDPEEQMVYWKVRHGINQLIANNDGLLHHVPLFDGAVPPDRLREYLEGLYEMMKLNNLPPTIWGHAGTASLHTRPKLNLGQVGDRQKAFRMLEEHHRLVLGLNGTISGSAGDGRMQTPYLEAMYGSEAMNLLKKVKQIFDPHGILNPGVKFGTGVDELKAMIRPDFSIERLYDHLPKA